MLKKTFRKTTTKIMIMLVFFITLAMSPMILWENKQIVYSFLPSSSIATWACACRYAHRELSNSRFILENDALGRQYNQQPILTFYQKKFFSRHRTPIFSYYLMVSLGIRRLSLIIHPEGYTIRKWHEEGFTEDEIQAFVEESSKRGEYMYTIRNEISVFQECGFSKKETVELVTIENAWLVADKIAHFREKPSVAQIKSIASNDFDLFWCVVPKGATGDEYLELVSQVDTSIIREWIFRDWTASQILSCT